MPPVSSTLKVQPTALSTGRTVRVVDLGAGLTPRYAIETPQGADAMGTIRWGPAVGFTADEVLAILVAIGYMPA